MIVVDASAIVAILMREAGYETLVAALKSLTEPVTSPLGVFEATLAVRRILGCPTAEAERVVMNFLSVARIQVLAFPEDLAHDAIAAFDRFGKGTGRAAKLNMGDCFAYAQARRLGVALLYKGDDFALTDIESASAQL